MNIANVKLLLSLTSLVSSRVVYWYPDTMPLESCSVARLLVARNWRVRAIWFSISLFRAAMAGECAATTVECVCEFVCVCVCV